ncbi:MAG: M20/M25/M40 family metallo-hydrolase, partial [Myxococcota bacterium]
MQAACVRESTTLQHFPDGRNLDTIVSTSGNKLRQRLAEATLELVRIPSVTGDERKIAHHMERWALGLPSVGRDDVIRQGNSLIIGQPDGRRPCVALCGHLDTVPPHASDPEPSLDAGRVHGRGASDMKGGIAVMQLLYEELELERLPFNVMLIFYDGEEGPYENSGLGPLLDSYEILHDVDLAIAMEPTDNTLQLGCLGNIHARIVVHGKTGHSARPWEGDNAIHKAGPLLVRLAGRPVNEVRVGELVFRESMTVTMASGGIARNVLPDRFEMNLNYRFAATDDIPGAIEAAKQAIRTAAPEAEIDLTDVAPPGTVPTDNPVLEHLTRQGELEVR